VINFLIHTNYCEYNIILVVSFGKKRNHFNQVQKKLDPIFFALVSLYEKWSSQKGNW